MRQGDQIGKCDRRNITIGMQIVYSNMLLTARTIVADREEAADAVHDVILRSSQKLDQLRDPSKCVLGSSQLHETKLLQRTRQRSRRDHREV